MCVTAIAWRAHPRWHLVVIANRDEFHARPSAPLAGWGDGSGTIAGRDLRSGGTWLGIRPAAGRFALVTNRRGYGDPDPARASRGGLVVALLRDAGDEETGPPALDRYNPFNVLAVAGGALRFLTNRPLPLSTPLPSGIYGLSNGALDEPWPKTLALKSALLAWLAADVDRFESLFGALAGERLPDAGIHPATASDVSAEPRDTAPFIRDARYGTRCSTVIAIDRDGHGRIVERRFGPDAVPAGDSSVGFRWEQA